jgi:hypothetical protein
VAIQLISAGSGLARARGALRADGQPEVSRDPHPRPVAELEPLECSWKAVQALMSISELSDSLRDGNGMTREIKADFIAISHG